MRFLTTLATILASNANLIAALDAPFHTDGRWIIDNAGNNFTYIGVNWPSHGETMVAEGLQYQSLSTIVRQMKTLGFNSIRLTFATELVDNILEGGDVTIKDSFARALGAENGAKVFQQVITNNPQFDESTTRLQVYDAIAAETAAQGIYVHLDNHVSKAMWCCSFTDGNTFFGDDYFDVEKWKRGLEYMARHAASWPNFVSIALRNELRPDLVPNLGSFWFYGWEAWYDNMVPAADRVHAANPDALIFFSGLLSDLTLYPIPPAWDLGNGKRFVKNDFSYADKLVLEIHNYDTSMSNCDVWKASMGFTGFDAHLPSSVNHMPVLMTEFGFSQQDETYNSIYATCLRDFVTTDQKAGWFVWLIGGSYYIREGTQDHDESYGLLTHDWKELRNTTIYDAVVGEMVKRSEAYFG